MRGMVTHHIIRLALVAAALASVVLALPPLNHDWLVVRSRPSQSNTLPLLSVPAGKDSGYALGYAMGSTFARVIGVTANFDTDAQQLADWFEKHPAVFGDMLNRTQSRYPSYVDELRGIADGSGVNFTLIAALNMEDLIPGIFPASGPSSFRGHCWDVISWDDGGYFLAHGHNEDGDDFYAINQMPYLVQTSTFLAYHYPGQLAGSAFAFNRYGLSLTCNSVAPALSNPLGGIAGNFIIRDVMEAQTIQEAIDRLVSAPAAYGFSFNIASLHEDAAVNVEVAPDSYTVTRLGKSSLSLSAVLPHFNMYTHLNIPQDTDESSVHRMARYQQLKPEWVDDIVKFLGDTADPAFPVYRSGGSDALSTLATLVIDFEANQIRIFTDNPAKSQPSYTFSFAAPPPSRTSF